MQCREDHPRGALSRGLKRTMSEPIASREDPSAGAPVFAAGDFEDRTFMGGISVSTRVSLFVIFALALLAGGGFGLFQAQGILHETAGDLSRAQQTAVLKTQQAMEVTTFLSLFLTLTAHIFGPGD